MTRKAAVERTAQRAFAIPPDSRLVAGAMRNLSRLAHRRMPAWYAAARLFAVGSQAGHELCEAHGIDPKSEVGPTEWERLDSALGETVDLTEELWEDLFGCDPPPESER